MYKIFEQLLQENHITQNKFAKLSGVPQSTLSNWKNNVSTPKTSTMQKIADFFNVSVDYLLGQTDIKNKPSTNSEELNKEFNILFDGLKCSSVSKCLIFYFFADIHFCEM